MATKRFAVRKNDDADAEIGTFTLEQLRDRIARGEITEIDFVRDADKQPPAKWTQIKEVTRLIATRRPPEHKASPVAPPGSRGAVRTPPSPAPVTAAAGSPAGVDGTWLRKDTLPVIVASLALLMTLLNTGWLLLAYAETDEPKSVQPAAQSEPRAGVSKPSPSAVQPRPDEPTTAQAKVPRNDGDFDEARKDTQRPQKKQPATLDEVVSRLDRIDARLADIDQRAEMQASRNLLHQGVEAGVLEFRVADTPFRFIFVPAGKFRFGYPAEEQNRVVRATGNPNSFLNATPECNVTIARGFFMLDREITVAQWKSCTDDAAVNSAPAPVGQGPPSLDSPKCDVTWLEARSFCAALQKSVPALSGGACELRLPTEIEWEYASRGGQGLLLPWVPQSGPTTRFLGSVKGTAAAPIAVDPQRNKDLSWRGQFDFAGNVAEWCLDSYDQSLHEALAKRQADTDVIYEPAEDSLAQAAAADKKGEGNPSRTLRGGSILDEPETCELPMRRFLLQNKGAAHIGFRPVIVLKKTIPPTAGEK